MERVKSSSQAGLTNTRPISITTNFKFQKVEKLNNLVSQISQTTRITKDEESLPFNNATQTRQSKIGLSEKVLELMKNKIKSNYDQLYSNYNVNKEKILKKIQAVETNLAGQNAMNTKFDEINKEKGKYDKMKSEIDEKQRQLKKLLDVRDQLKNQKTQNQNDGNEIIQKIEQFQIRKQQIEHQSLILNNMLSERKSIQLNLRQKYGKMLEELNTKRQKQSKMLNGNLKKRGMLAKIEEDLSKQEQVQIPNSLAQQLSNKLQIYENKHSYNNIIQHQAQIQEQKYRKMKQEINTERQKQRIIRNKKQVEEKNKYDQLYNMFMIKNYEEEKIKKLCGVQYLQEITKGDLLSDKQNLEVLSNQISSEIKELELANNQLEEDIKQMLNLDDELASIDNVYKLQKECEKHQQEKNMLADRLIKKKSRVNEWQTIIHLLCNDGNEASLNEVINQIQQIYEKKIVIHDDQTASNDTKKDIKFTKINYE